MSDFLKKFSNESYKEVKKPVFIEEKQEEENDRTIDKEVPQKEPELSDVVLPSSQDQKDTKTTFQTSNTKDEIYVRDDEMIKNRKIKIIIGVVSAVFILIIGIFTYYKMNQVNVPHFIEEKTLNDVQVWAAKNKIDMDYTSVFSIKADEGYIVKQSKKKGMAIQKGSSFEVVVSKGANPDEHIKVPDFMSMNLTKLEAWKKQEKAVNVSIEKVFSEEVEKSKVISFEYKSEGIDEKNYRRKDKINVVVSKGKEVFEKDIEVPNFKDKGKEEVETWANEKGVIVEFSEVEHNKIPEGKVISQDIGAKTMIAKNDVIKIVISRGKISYAPNFSGLDETQGQIAAVNAEVSINVVHYYSNTIRSGYLISQSIPYGSEVTHQTIALLYSLGKPYIGNFDGSDVFTMVQSIDEMNGKGAQLTYELVEVSSTEKKGNIITSNYKANFVNIGSHIVISVSRGS